MKKVILRADSSPEIGLGHVYRMISVAHMLAGKFECCFVTNQPANIPPAEVADLNMPIVAVPGKKYILPDSKKSNDETPFDLQEIANGNEIVITDGYWFGTNYQKEVKNKGCKLVCIDDLHNKVFFADLIINHAPGVGADLYTAQAYTRFALGTAYAMLRPSFLQQAMMHRSGRTADRLLICFGGSDFLGLTIPVLEMVLATNVFKHISIVVGTGYTNDDALKKEAGRFDHITIHKNINERELLDIMLQSETAIVPASGILYETLAAGCTTLTGFYSSNQQDIYNGFVAKNAVFACGDFSNFKSDLDRFIEIKDAYAPAKIIDGRSGSRITEAISSIS